MRAGVEVDQNHLIAIYYRPDPPHSSSSLGAPHHVLSFVRLVSRLYFDFVTNRTCKTSPTGLLFTAVPVNHFSGPPMTLSLFSSNYAKMIQTVGLYAHTHTQLTTKAMLSLEDEWKPLSGSNPWRCCGSQTSPGEDAVCVGPLLSARSSSLAASFEFRRFC